MKDHATPPPGSLRSRSGKIRGFAIDLAGFLILGAVSLVVGCLVNRLRAKPLPWVYESRAQVLDQAVARLEDHPSTVPSLPGAADEPPHEIRLDDFQSFVMARKGVVLDARPFVFYREAHVPGALSLPREAFAETYPLLRATLDPSKDQPIAIYCSGADCPDSQLLSDALTKLGFRRLLIYTSGWEEWSQTGLPQEGKPTPP